MANYATPGVYLERPAVRRPPVTALRTDVAGFVGVASRGPLHEEILIASSERFTEIFGPPIEDGYLAYAVQGFFANGGRRCWIVRVANRETSSSARWTVYSNEGRRAFELKARYPGTWAICDLTVSASRAGEHRFHLLLRFRDGHQEFWSNLSTDPEDSRAYFKIVINGFEEDSRNITQTAQRPDRSSFVEVGEIYAAGRWNVQDGAAEPLEFGQDGLAALQPEDFVGGTPEALNGLSCLKQIDEISVVAIPDIMPPQRPVSQQRLRRHECDQRPAGEGTTIPRPPSLLDRGFGRLGRRFVLPEPEQRPAFSKEEVLYLQSEMVKHCTALRDRFAVLDPFSPQDDEQAIVQWRQQFDSKFAALYFPWIHVENPLGDPGAVRAVPPSGHVTGLYARVSLAPGVHKPPAGERIEDARDVARLVDETNHGALNSLGVNVIKPYEGRGILAMGARTVSSDREWQFVNVRRLVTMIEASVEEQLQWAVFEPHTQGLRRDVDRSIRGLLTNLWQRGMLDGAEVDEAFSVTCDDSTNTSYDVDEGRLICQIVLNAPWPAEFVVVRIGIGDRGIQFVERSGG